MLNALVTLAAEPAGEGQNPLIPAWYDIIWSAVCFVVILVIFWKVALPRMKKLLDERSAAIEGKPKGLRINAVLPGAIDTPMLWNNPNVKSGVEKINPTDVGKPEDVAATIAYLASDDAAFVQGTEVQVDGGRLDHL